MKKELIYDKCAKWGMKSNEEIEKKYFKNVKNKLHVVFTMNPADKDMNKTSETSPALFNRCVIDWFHDWSDEEMKTIGKKLTIFCINP